MPTPDWKPMKPPPLGVHDWHVVTNGKTNKEKVYAQFGLLLKTYDVFPHGVNGPSQEVVGGDTVEQLYLLGAPQWTRPEEDLETVRRPYGWVFIPMLDYEGREASLGRAGIGRHGGGHMSDFWQPRQELVYTHGCVRMYNETAKWLALKVEEIQGLGGKVWNTVIQ